jgi:F-type H+-transporting ATPase subunit a
MTDTAQANPIPAHPAEGAHATQGHGEGGGLPEFLWAPFHGKTQPVYLGWVAIGIILVFALIGKATQKKVPGLIQSLFEFVLEFIENILHQAMGPSGMRYYPLFVSFFLFILIGNLLGLIPGMASPTSAVNTTLALAMITFLSTHVLGMINKGVLGYWGHFFHVIDSSQSTGLIKLIMLPLQYVMLPAIELIGEAARPLSLTMRLFGNIIAKETLLAVLFAVTAGLFYSDGIIYKALMVVPFLLAPGILVLGVLVSLLQAIVFTVLSMVYIAGATAVHEEHEEEGHGHKEAAHSH